MSPELEFLLKRIRAHADDEGLLPWTTSSIAPLAGVGPAETPGVMQALHGTGFVLLYRAGRPRRQYAYLIGSERSDGTSSLPPPSLQSGGTLLAYTWRDEGRCHLCRYPISRHYDRPREWPTFDHLIPRSAGGSDYPSNIRIAHGSCNKARRNRAIDRFSGSPASRHLASLAPQGAC